MQSNILSINDPIYFSNGNYASQLKEVLEPVTRQPFYKLIEMKHRNGLPYILGITPECFNSERDGTLLHKATVHGIDPYSGSKINEAYYYAIHPNSESFEYLGKMTDKNQEYLETVFKANEGDVEALHKFLFLTFKMANYYVSEKNYDEAAKHFAKALSFGKNVLLEGDLILIYSFFSRYFLDKDPLRAEDAFKLGINLGDQKAIIRLAYQYAEGKNFEQNINEATSLINHFIEIDGGNFTWVKRILNLRNVSNDVNFQNALTRLETKFYPKKASKRVLGDVTNRSAVFVNPVHAKPLNPNAKEFIPQMHGSRENRVY